MMSNKDKRYSVSVLFHIYAENDKKALDDVISNIAMMETTSNHQIISIVEQPFASIETREVDFKNLEHLIFNESEIN